MKTIFISVLCTLTVLAFLLSIEAQPTGRNDHKMSNRSCRIRAVDPLTHGRIRNKLAEGNLNLIEYKLTFSNYSYNPMTTNVTRYHKADTWSRVSTFHGQILLSLAFNYGVLSLMTLTFGTDSSTIELEDIPSGCIGGLPEEQKVQMVQHLLMRDFKEDGNVSIVGEEKVCNIQIINQSGYAKFTDYCCFLDTLTRAQVCESNEVNEWLRVMWLMLTVVRYGVLFFGPLLFLSTIAKLVNHKISYSVKLLEPLEKTILLSQNENDIKRFKVKRRVNLKNNSCCNLPKLMQSLCRRQLSIGSNPDLLDGEPFRSFIYDYRILVNYTRLLVEDEVPVGLWKLILKSVFFCELREVGPFVDCCKRSICKIGRYSCLPWIKFWKALGLALLVLLLPIPYYLRLLVFYFFEHNEVMSRREAVTNMGLSLNFENSIVHYLLPTHPLFLGIYAIYFTIAVTFAFASKMKENPFQKIIVGSFDDLHNLSWSGVLHMIVSNVIWPFEEFGIYAIFIVFIYWPIVLPITCLVSVGYCLPTVYLTIRMSFNSKTTILERLKCGLVKKLERSQQLFEIKTFWKLFHDSDKSNNDSKSNNPESGKYMRSWIKTTFIADSDIDKMKNFNPKTMAQPDNSTKTETPEAQNWKSRCGKIAVHTCTSTFCVAAMFSVLIILSECIGCLVEIMVFTMMGIIVNAGALLKYMALAMLILVYIYDSFNNVEKKYLQLNKALFNDVKDRVKGVEEVTSLPSELQENTGFKSQELSEQGDHEESDDVAKELSRHWFINDLVLFIDKEDVPRIPKKLFEEVCQIDVAGVPGPVYLGLFSAFKSFVKMAIFVVFVFLAILSFGSATGLSSTTQTIAALAGGSVPLLLKTFIKVPKPDIEMGTVSFSNKLDEVVMNFYQFWPMNDFCFEMQPRKKEKGSADKDAPIESANSVANSREGTSAINTASKDTGQDNENIPGIILLGAFDRKAAEKKDKGELTKLLRREMRNDQDLQEVDIIIILPDDFDKLWSDEWTKFCTEQNSKKEETTDPIYERSSRKSRFRKSSTRRPRKGFPDYVPKKESSGVFKEVKLDERNEEDSNV